MMNKSTRREALLTVYGLQSTVKQKRAVVSSLWTVSQQNGFTLIELLVAIAITILAGTLFWRFF
jgi:prepilin-type N-terminal cleavage/methylation domain-containing protein